MMPPLDGIYTVYGLWLCCAEVGWQRVWVGLFEFKPTDISHQTTHRQIQHRFRREAARCVQREYLSVYMYIVFMQSMINPGREEGSVHQRHRVLYEEGCSHSMRAALEHSAARLNPDNASNRKWNGICGRARGCVYEGKKPLNIHNANTQIGRQIKATDGCVGGTKCHHQATRLQSEGCVFRTNKLVPNLNYIVSASQTH